MAARNWTVLLIGGGSGTGKSTLAARLSRRYRIPWMHADDIRMALEHVVRPADEPLLQFFHDDANWLRHSPAELTRTHERISRIACKGLAIVVSHHIAMEEPVVIEGDDLLPPFIARMHREYGTQVRGIVLHERDGVKLREQMLTRDRGIMRRSAAIRERMIELAYADGSRLRRGAQRAGLPLTESRPFRTLPSRVIDSLA